VADGGPAPEVCELCSVEIDSRHGHVADLQTQRLLCTCRSCFLLFTGSGAGAGRFRALPERSRRVDSVAISQGQWDALQIPVDLAFFFLQTGAESFAACYPGPGGATESLLDLGAWALVCEANPVLGQVEPDVEAVLLRRTDDAFECFLVPIDRCYELVGLVRQSWVGFSGGQEVWGRIDAFFAAIRAASQLVDRHGSAVAHA
jgi:hypothetical protein